MYPNINSTRVIEYVGSSLNISKSQVSRLLYIDKHLINELKTLLSKCYFTMSTAYELAQYQTEMQRLAVTAIISLVDEPVQTEDIKNKTKTSLTIADIKAIMKQISINIINGTENSPITLSQKRTQFQNSLCVWIAI